MAYGRWGRRDFEHDSPLSILDLVKNGTLDLKLASLFWLLMETRPSVIVAAGPSNVGKTTTLEVLMDFMRPEVKQVQLQGDDEDFSFVKKAKPANTYQVAAEFSNWGMYVWGEVAVRAFELVSKGFGLGGTIHAQSAREVIEILHRYLGLPVGSISAIDFIVTLEVRAGRLYGSEPIRRVDTVTLLLPHEKGLAIDQIVSLASDGNTFEIAGDADLQAVLPAKFGLKKNSIVPDMKAREQILSKLIDDGKTSREEVRKAVIEFYNSQS